MDPTSQQLMMGAAGAGGGEKTYIEDVFSTWLYTGNGGFNTIINDIDLATEGGLVWLKRRNGTPNHFLYDTARGTNKYLSSNTTTAEVTDTTRGVDTFNTTGFRLEGSGDTNSSGDIFTSWTFRKAAKFFDVVTYTGTGSARTVAHNLGSVPGCIIVKALTGSEDWFVYHRSLGGTKFLRLNLTDASGTSSNIFNNTEPTSSVFTAGSSLSYNGTPFVAYLFAHETDADSLIQCGSYTGNGSTSGPVIDLGWEPQWLLIKKTNAIGNWGIFDAMRGMVVDGPDFYSWANSSSDEKGGPNYTLKPTSTGFQLQHNSSYSVGEYNSNGDSYIYIAIRRGPMKTPTDATKVFQPKLYTGTNADNRLVTTDIVTDMVWVRQRNDTVLAGMVVGDRLRGQPYLLTGGAAAEVDDADSFDQQLVTLEYGTAWSSMTGFWVGNDATSKLNANTTSNNHVALAFRRAPGFFDVVAYTGTGVARTVAHNLGVAPEMIIIRHRNIGGEQWRVYSAPNGATGGLNINLADSFITSSSFWNDTAPTSSVFTVGTEPSVNSNGKTFVAYLFASCPGVSKVGSYTGTGTTLQVDCGFTAGARFVLIKRTDSSGGWYIWDTARGIVSGNDPYLLLNSTAAEVTSTDYIEPLNSGFEISSSAPAAINANGGTFIYLAIA